MYQVQVKFIYPGEQSPKGVWLPVASAKSKDKAREYAAIWRPSAVSNSIGGVRIMSDGKEVKP
jgi:hypothetical protein